MSVCNSSGIVRLATLEDAPILQQIYAYYVDKTVVSFETKAPDVDEFRSRIQQISRDFPYLVYESDGRILGYAYAHRCFEREAYAWNAETTVYLDVNERGHGVGGRLYGALIEFLTAMEYRNLYAVIVSENVESCRFHERNGFKLFSVFKKSGWKDGRWLDVSWYDLQVASFDGPPVYPLSFSTLSEEYVNDVCRRFSGRGLK